MLRIYRCARDGPTATAKQRAKKVGCRGSFSRRATEGELPDPDIAVLIRARFRARSRAVTGRAAASGLLRGGRSAVRIGAVVLIEPGLRRVKTFPARQGGRQIDFAPFDV